MFKNKNILVIVRNFVTNLVCIFCYIPDALLIGLHPLSMFILCNMASVFYILSILYLLDSVMSAEFKFLRKIWPALEGNKRC